MHWAEKQWKEKRMEAASEFVDSDHGGRCQQPGVAGADCESKLDVCHRSHLDFFLNQGICKL